MAKFDPFGFVRNRKICVPPTEEEKSGFNLFMVNMAISMANGVNGILEKTNTEAFYKLSKKTQCMAFTSLDGKNLSGPWQKSRKTAKNEADKELQEMITKLFNCSDNQAKNYIKYKLVDTKKINDLYQRIYDPSSVKIRKKRTKNG